MNAGENKIEITPNWTWYLIDYIRVASGSSSSVEFNIAAAPVDAKATEGSQEGIYLPLRQLRQEDHLRYDDW